MYVLFDIYLFRILFFRLSIFNKYFSRFWSNFQKVKSDSRDGDSDSQCDRHRPSWVVSTYIGTTIRSLSEKVNVNFVFSGGPVLLGHLLGWVLQKCKKWNISLNLATLMVAQMFKHASTMGQGYLGQSCADKTSPCTIDLFTRSSSVKCGTFDNKIEAWKVKVWTVCPLKRNML